VAGALERKVWLRTAIGELYPNLYTVLVGPPGVGKTVVTSIVQSLWGELPDHHLAPSSVSRASLIDALRDAERRVVMPSQNPPVLTFHSLLIAANELGVLIPGYDNDFMNTLTDIYDGKRYGEKKRSKELNFILHHPQLNLLAATTPSYLNNVMPEGAWDQGFISRVIVVYSGENIIRDLFTEIVQTTGGYTDLLHDLKIIGSAAGKIKFEEDAAHAINHWNKLKGPPTPEHPKLIHYNARRTTQLLKLCMVASICQRNDLVVTLKDYAMALDWLLEVEAAMPEVFKSMAIGGDARAIEDTYYFAYQYWLKTQQPIHEARLIDFLQTRVPAHNVERIIQLMVKGRMFEKRLDGYVPRPKKPD